MLSGNAPRTCVAGSDLGRGGLANMKFETNRDVLEWYERQPRALTPEFISAIPWNETAQHSIDERFIPVLLYMRDVETLTDMYHRQMMRTPTGKDPDISKFMERWGVEEITHGEVWNRFLHEIGVETGEKWQVQVRRAVSRTYRANTYLMTMLTNMVGKRFTATHMAFGAIHEMSTIQAYRRLRKLAGHPVLSQILDAIIREESAHTNFYTGVAKLELRKSHAAQRIARFVIEKFWVPVGQGSLHKSRTDYLITTLFGGSEGLDWVDKTVTKRVVGLPGFDGLTTINDTARRICEKAGRANGVAVRMPA